MPDGPGQTNVDEWSAEARRPAAEPSRVHAVYRGEVEAAVKRHVGDVSDFTVCSTPGLAAPCRATTADL